MEPKSLAVDATLDHLERDADGKVSLPERPGLGVQPDLSAFSKAIANGYALAAVTGNDRAKRSSLVRAHFLAR